MTPHVVVQGTGDWVQRAVRRDLTKLRTSLGRRNPTPLGSNKPRRRASLEVHYVGIAAKPPFKPNSNFENYYCSFNPSDAKRLAEVKPDLVVVASPDYAHVDDLRSWMLRGARPCPLLVEKPFSDESHHATDLMRDHARSKKMQRFPVFCIDHYNWYMAPYVGLLPDFDDWLGAVSGIRFCMTERGPVESHRLRSLGSGITFDMGAHFLGVVSLFADLPTREADSVDIGYSGRHSFYGDLKGRHYFAETAVEMMLRLKLRGTVRPIPVYGRVGKSLRDAKYIDFLGRDERIARVDLRSERATENGYPFGGAFTARRMPLDDVPLATRNGSSGPPGVVDPYDSDVWLSFEGPVLPQVARQLSWYRHGRLVESFVTGDWSDWDFLLTPEQGIEILRLLESYRDKVVKLDPYDLADDKWQRNIESLIGAPGVH